MQQKYGIIWLTGQSGAGKSTISELLPFDCIRLDGNEMRESISKGLGFSKEDRRENNLRIARLAKVLSSQKLVVVSVIAPMETVRKEIDAICQPFWVYVQRNLPEREGHFYEKPEDPDLVLDHDDDSALESAANLTYAFRNLNTCKKLF